MSDDAAERDASDADAADATAADVGTTAGDEGAAGTGADAGEEDAEAGSGTGTGAGNGPAPEQEGERAEVPEASAGSEGDVVDRDLADRVAAHDEALAAEVRDLEADLAESEDRVAELEERVEELEAKLTRKAADFENYKKRTEQRREELKERAAEDLVERIVDVRDDLVRALDQDEDADLRDGLRSTLSTFDRILEDENVEPVEPDPGDEVDPHRHEVMMRVESDLPEDRIVDRYRPGYVMAGRVIQTAQVTVSDGPPDGADGTDGSDAADGDAADGEGPVDGPEPDG